MENKHVGLLIIGIAIIMASIVLIFNVGLKDLVDETCSHGSECTMYNTIAVQTWISLAITAIILIIGMVIMFSKPKERIVEKTIIKKVQEKKKPLDLKGLNEIERKAMALIQEENAIFQKTLMEKLEIGKVGMTRMLDKLEAKQLIERKRRGNNNVVVVKN